MAFNASVNLGTVGKGITGQTVSISGCTGPSCASGCSSLATSQAVSSFPKTLTGIPDGTLSLFIKVDGGDCSGTNQCITIAGIPTATPTPTSTATPTSTVGVTSTPTSTSTPTPTSTATPTSTPTSTLTATPTATANGVCYTLLYSSVPSDLYVRYRSKTDDLVKTELITSLESMDNGNNTYTAAICVSSIAPYNSPVFVQGGIEVSGGNLTWESGGSCTSNGTCFLPGEPEPITFSVTPSCVGYAPTGVTITINNASGGSGTGYYVKMTSPSGNDTPHNLPYAYTGLNNYVGNTYAFTVYDSEDTPSNNVALTQDYSCASAPNNTAFANLVIQSTQPSSAQCSSGTGYTFDLGSPSATFCNATTFTASGLTGLGTGNNYWLCYNGQTRQVFHPSNAGYFQSAGGCQTV
jgi:hypothetical protein